jgi:hypothetical protein
VDGTFAFFTSLNINTYWAKTETTNLRGDDTSYRLHLDYNGDRYGVQLERINVGDHFNPELGFLRRDDMLRNGAQLRFSPRPKRFASRSPLPLPGEPLVGGKRRRRARVAGARGRVRDRVPERRPAPARLQQPVRTAPGAVSDRTHRVDPVGAYDFQDGRITMNFGRHRRLGGTVSLERGSFYDGDRTTLSTSQSRVSVTNALSLEPTLSINKVDLRQGSFNTRLVGSRVTYTVTPLMFVSALVQYNTSTNSVSTNARMRWEYRPGSEFFVVYNDERNTLTRGFRRSRRAPSSSRSTGCSVTEGAGGSEEAASTYDPEDGSE